MRWTTRKIKLLKTPLMALMLSVVLGCLSGGAVTAQPLLLDKIVAVVNDEAILLSELEEEMGNVRRALEANQMPVPALPIFERQVLERLILKHLQLDWAKNSAIRVDDSQLNQALSDIAASNQLTLSEMIESIESEGVNYPQFRARIRDDMMITQLRRRFFDTAVTVTPEEIQNYMNHLGSEVEAPDVQYRVAHILIAISDTADEDEVEAAQQHAEQLFERAKSGENFAKLAQEYSDATTALQGGELDWRTENELPTLFAQSVPKMAQNEVGGPWRQLGGFHIVKLLERRETGRYMIEQTRASHILLSPDKVTSEEEVRARLEGYRQAILEGASFEELARAHSQDQVSAEQGGDLGWASPGLMVPEFEEAVSQLSEGELSPIFQSRFGWHLVQLKGRREHDATDEWLQSRAHEEIHRRKAEEEYDLWLRRMRDEAFIEVRL